MVKVCRFNETAHSNSIGPAVAPLHSVTFRPMNELSQKILSKKGYRALPDINLAN
jgi:hypothetical protein